MGAGGGPWYLLFYAGAADVGAGDGLMETAGEPTTDATPRSARPDGTRRPGWFPDESLPGRFRHWDGGAWNSMLSTHPVWGPEGEPADRAGLARSRTIRGAVAVAAALVLLAGAGFVISGDDDEVAADRVVAGSDDDTEVMADTLDRDSGGDGTDSPGSPGSSDSPDSGDPVSNSRNGASGSGAAGSNSGSEGDSAPGGESTGPAGSGDAGTSAGSARDGGSNGSVGATLPGGTGPGGEPIGSPSPDQGDGGGPADMVECEPLGGHLQDLLRAFPGLQAVSPAMTIDEVRCNARWASGIAVSPVTPRSLAVFELQADSWVLVAYGTSAPCRHLALSDQLAEQLRC